MCKNFNPCCCCASSKLAVTFIGWLDIVIGIWTVIAAGFAWSDLRRAMQSLTINHIGKTYAWLGALIIPLSGFIQAYNGFYLVNNRDKPSSRYQILKVLAFVVLEGIVFIVPYYIVDDFSQTIDHLTSLSFNFLMYKLLSLNAGTILLYLYEIYSCVVVWHHQLNVPSTPVPVPVQTSARPRNHVLQPIILQPANPIMSTTVTTVAIQDETLTRVRGLASINRVPSNRNSIVRNSFIYPDLHTLQASLLPLPTRSECMRNTIELDSIEVGDARFKFLKKDCLKRAILFEDQEFPADSSSIQRVMGPGNIEWKRPHEIIDTAQFCVNGMDRFDVMQGDLGNCWFLAALASVTEVPSLMEKIIPPDNDWNNGDYCGIFHFRFWMCTRWIEIIIDDRLPTRNNELVFMRSGESSEFWSPLLEKAYAKLKGSYGSLEGGWIKTGFVNLTGGSCEQIHLDQNVRPENLFSILNAALERKALIGCSITNAYGNFEEIRSDGLVFGHAYSITGVKKVSLTGLSKREAIVRIRNPWGNHVEWNGKFSDKHWLWERIDKATRHELQLIFKNDGEFWFPLKEFTDYFDLLEICYLNY